MQNSTQLYILKGSRLKQKINIWKIRILGSSYMCHETPRKQDFEGERARTSWLRIWLMCLEWGDMSICGLLFQSASTIIKSKLACWGPRQPQTPGLNFFRLASLYVLHLLFQNSLLRLTVLKALCINLVPRIYWVWDCIRIVMASMLT
jgi:hypothetical protein